MFDFADLVRAVETGALNTVEEFVRNQPESLTLTAESGVSLLMTALYHRQPAVADVLAEHGPPLTFFEACAMGRLATVKTLQTANSAVLTEWSSDGFTPLHLGAFFNRDDVVDHLLRAGAVVNAVARNDSRVTPIHSAAAADSTKIVSILLEFGADANAQQRGGYTALHSAAMHGNVDMVNVLLQHGAELTLKADDGQCAVDFAKQRHHETVVSILQTAVK